MVQLRERPGTTQVVRPKAVSPSPSLVPVKKHILCTKCHSRLIITYGDIQCSQCSKEYSRADVVRMAIEQGVR